jgi:hypothetical protein
MGYTHSHRCWVGNAPVRGVETHQRWRAASARMGIGTLWTAQPSRRITWLCHLIT